MTATTPIQANADYEAFLRSKAPIASDFGVPLEPRNQKLFPFQRAITRWGLKKGRAAIFADCGLGKTLMELSWAQEVADVSRGRVLILAPLAVAAQTEAEAIKFGIEGVARALDQTQADASKQPIIVANYDRLDDFDASAFEGVVCDESGILKSFMGKTKRALCERFARTPWRLACTATPAPNDHMELGNHADFLGAMASNEMLARWFINDAMEAGNYRLKGHAEKDFWRWVHTWAVSLDKPSDVDPSFSDDGFVLPQLNWREVRVSSNTAPAEGSFLPEAALSATSIHRVMRQTAPDRAAAVAELVNSSSEEWVVWCNTNYEADELVARIPGAVEVRGNESAASKEKKLMGFSRGEFRVMISKPSLAGFGLNWQHCRNAAFVGLSYSYEQLYQALRRVYRFGQTREVNAYLVTTDAESCVLETVKRKMAEHGKMKSAMVEAMRANGISDTGEAGCRSNIESNSRSGNGWTLHRGDCVRVMKTMPKNSVHFSVHSPPFANLYIYSDHLEDMGNCADYAEFFLQYEFCIAELHRILKPGGIVAVHCKDLPRYKGRDGSAGLTDFPGQIIAAFERAGFTFHSRVTIWKCPVTEMQRTKNHGLLYKQLRKDSRSSRMGMADYIVAFRKWEGAGETTEFADPVEHTKDSFTLDDWQQIASPVWMDINQTNVLQYRNIGDNEDERHICPLQLDVIERCVKLWSAPGQTVFSPFAGIGSEGFVALQMGRKFIGAELKESYWRQACANLTRVSDSAQLSIFDLAECGQEEGA